MKKDRKTKSPKGFRIDPDIEPRLTKVASELRLPQSWFVNEALRKQMPDFEKMAKERAA